MTTRTDITATQDSYINVEAPDTNYGSSTGLAMLNVTGQFRRSYVYFPLNVAQLADAVVLEASLSLRLKTPWGTGDLIVKRVTDPWKENTITFANEPAATTSGQASATMLGAPEERIDIDITDIVAAWIGGQPVYGLRLTTTAATMRSVYACEAGVFQKPILTIIWKTPPDPPVDLRPSGGQAVKAAAPLLAWSGDLPAAFQVQIDNAGDFSSPDFDSGWVAEADISYDTSDDGSPPSLTDDTDYYWRVRVRDGDGLESEWSDVAQFQRRSVGVLTITAPSSVVEETTPTISHTFTGRSQAYVEYILYETVVHFDEVITTEVYRRPKTPQTATDFQLPAGYIRSTDATYTITVNVWDDFNRAETDGVPYVTDSTDFTFALSSTPDPVADLVARQDQGHILLTWTRASDPDYYAVREDGLIIRDRVEVSEAALGGTDYALPIYTAAPRVEHTYVVEAVVEDGGVFQHAEGSPEATVTLRPKGIWIIDPETGAEVRVLGKDSMDVSLGETGVTLYPLGRRDPVRIVDQVRGLEGTVSGQLVSANGRDAAGERRRFLDMKADPVAVRRLVMARRNIPVRLSEASVDETPTVEETYGFQVGFFQVGEFEVE